MNSLHNLKSLLLEDKVRRSVHGCSRLLVTLLLHRLNAGISRNYLHDVTSHLSAIRKNTKIDLCFKRRANCGLNVHFNEMGEGLQHDDEGTPGGSFPVTGPCINAVTGVLLRAILNPSACMDDGASTKLF